MTYLNVQRPISAEELQESVAEHDHTYCDTDALRIGVWWDRVGDEFDGLDEYVDWEIAQDGTLTLANVSQRDSKYELPPLDDDLDGVNALFSWVADHPELYAEPSIIIEVLS